MKHLFTVEMDEESKGGTITATCPAPEVYLLTFNSPPDNRLTSSFNRALLLALDIIEHRYPTGVVITTSGIAKFYSNGMDIPHVASTPGFLANSFYVLFARLSTYPMPTVALLNGHAFAGGLIMAMHHDYRVQNPSKGFLSMNEIVFGGLMEPPMLAVYREKTSPSVYRKIILEAHRFGAKEALEERIVDATGGLEETLKFIKDRGLVDKGKSGIYGRVKEDMYRQTLDYLTSHDQNVRWRKSVELARREHDEEIAEKVAEWEAKGGKAEGGQRQSSPAMVWKSKW